MDAALPATARKAFVHAAVGAGRKPRSAAEQGISGDIEGETLRP
jgi:hypothetical protein